MNCQEYRDLIEDALDVSLHGEPERMVRLHLEHCASCRDYFKLRQDAHVALFSGINAACEELRLPEGFADRLAESVRNRRSARRGWRRLALPRWAMIAASVAAMLGFAFAANVVVEGLRGAEAANQDGESEGTKEAEGAEATVVEVAYATAIAPSTLSVPLASSGPSTSSNPSESSSSSTQATGNQLETNQKGETLMSKVKAATAALTAAFAATPLAAANGGGDYQFIISGDPVAAEAVGSSSDSSATSALESGTLADGVVLESAFETRYCTWYDSPARSLRSDECRGMIISFR